MSWWLAGYNDASQTPLAHAVITFHHDDDDDGDDDNDDDGVIDDDDDDIFSSSIIFHPQCLREEEGRLKQIKFNITGKEPPVNVKM